MSDAGITIVGSGRYLPGPPVKNSQLERVMDTDDEWIRQRTGIEQRHFAPEGSGCSDLAYEASKKAIANAGLQPEDIDYILFGTMTPDYFFPGSGGLLGAKLGIPGVPALDIRQQCAAMIYGFQVAQGLLASGAAKTILLVGAEAHAGFMPWHDWDLVYSDEDRKLPPHEYDRATRHRGLAVIFGDGAGALVLRQHEAAGHGLLGTKVHTDGSKAEQLNIPAGFRQRPYLTHSTLEEELHIPRMKGRDLFKNAVTKLPRVVRELCAEKEITLEDIDLFVAHQANDRINNAVRQALKVPVEKVPSNIARYGNTSGATIPILLDELFQDGTLKPGMLLCFLALGTGLHWGAALMRL
ncbi:MAG: beta-ketoacyl-ACP synthase III [Myxococcota bacterium]